MKAHRYRGHALLACLLMLAVCAALAAVPRQSQQGQQQQGQQQQQQQGQQQGQQQDQKDKPAEKKPGGIFGGLKSVTSAKSSSETQLTSSGGAKGVGPGDGKKIAAAKPTAEDRAQVDRIASAAPSPAEMKQFLEQGRLSTEKKGGSR
jgi:hypothetical protein